MLKNLVFQIIMAILVINLGWKVIQADGNWLVYGAVPLYPIAGMAAIIFGVISIIWAGHRFWQQKYRPHIIQKNLDDAVIKAKAEIDASLDPRLDRKMIREINEFYERNDIETTDTAKAEAAKDKKHS